MPNDIEAELKHLEAKSKSDTGPRQRDPSMTGGERAETGPERKARKTRQQKPKRAPIIQRTP